MRIFKNTKTIFFVCIIIFSSCKSSSHDTENPNHDHYDINAPEIHSLPSELAEISGIDYYDKDSSLFAIADNKKSFFKIKPGRSIHEWKLSEGQDCEDVIQYDSSVYILQSNGDILEISFKGKNPGLQHHPFPQEYGKNEFESLYTIPGEKKLVMICKDCPGDKGGKVSTYTFDVTTKSFSDSSYKIDEKKILKVAAYSEKSHFMPSAAAINPKDNMVYILSSLNKCIAVTRPDGHVHEVFILNPQIYKQPEGLTFAPNGDMFISDEAASYGGAELFYLKYLSADVNK